MLDIFAGACVGIYSICWCLFHLRKDKHPLLVSLPGYPIIGNILHFLPDVVLKNTAELPKKYGDFIELYLVTMRVLFVSDVSVAQEIFRKRPKVYLRSQSTTYFATKAKVDKGLFFAEGDVWSRMRKLTAPSFSNLNLANKFPTMMKVIIPWIEKLKVLSENKQVPIDMPMQTADMTKSVITVVAVGVELDNPVCQYFFSKQCYDDIRAVLDFGLYSTIFRFPRWLWKYSPDYKYEILVQESDARFTAACQAVIDHRREQNHNTATIATKATNSSHSTLLDTLLDKETSNVSDEELIANMKTFYIAGSETTAITLTWVCYYFALFPEIAERVKQELEENILSSLPPSFSSSMITFETFTNENFRLLKFTSAVVKEILRLTAPVIILAHQSDSQTQDITLSNGIIIHPNDRIFLNINGIHYREEVFEHAEAFLPDRWLITDTNKLQQMEQHFMPFGGGSRICPGMGLAMIEAIVATALIAYNFKIELACPKEEIKRVHHFTFTANKMPVYLHLR